MDPLVARKTWRTVEPVHGMIYFALEAAEEYDAIGLRAGRMHYFASRSAPMGAVTPEVVIATFFNFDPQLVRHSMTGAWELASPAQVVAARFAAADRALRRVLGDGVLAPELAEGADLARQCAVAAAEHPEGRPLFAGHASLDWPDEPHLVLWHAQTMLREFRGDAHIASLLLDGCTGLDALIIHAATGEVPTAALAATRSWPDDAWAAAVDALRGRGLLTPTDPLALTEAGRTRRQWVEDRTDALCVGAYEAIGEDGCARLRERIRPFSRAIVDAGVLGPMSAARASES